MYSSFSAWELKQNHPNFLEEKAKGIYGLSCYDAFLEKIFLSKIPKHFLSEGKFSPLMASEFTKEWIDQNLLTDDFFNTKTSYKVLMGQEVSTEIIDYLLEAPIDWSERYLLFLCQSDKGAFDKLKKNENTHTLKVKEPAFWEQDKLLRFLMEQTGVRLAHDVQGYLLDVIPNEPSEFIHALKKLALSARDPMRLSVGDVMGELGHARLDQFQLAKDWGQKRLTQFYKSLLDYDGDEVSLLRFFQFIQSHIIKVMDPSYIAKKSRATKYDQQVEQHARTWKNSELQFQLSFFSNCEVLAKQKSQELIRQLRLGLIDSYKN